MNPSLVLAWAQAHPLVAGLAIYVVVEVAGWFLARNSLTAFLLWAGFQIGKALTDGNSLGGLIVDGLFIIALIVAGVAAGGSWMVVADLKNHSTQATVAASSGTTSQVQFVSNTSADAGANEVAAASTPEPTDLPGQYVVQQNGLVAFSSFPTSNVEANWPETIIVTRYKAGDVINVLGSVVQAIPGPNSKAEITSAKFFVVTLPDGSTGAIFANYENGQPTAVK